MKVGIVGYGDFGKQIHHFLKDKFGEQLTEVFTFDDFYKEENKNSNIRAFPFGNYTDVQFNDLKFYIGLGYKHLEKRSALLSELKKRNRNCPAFIHRNCFHDPTATIEDGCIIYPGSNLDQHVILKSGTVLNNSVTISHNAVIGNSVFIAPGVCVCGNVSIGNNSFIGAGSVISNNVKIGNNVRIGIGTVVSQNVPDNASVIGNPMRILNSKINLL